MTTYEKYVELIKINLAKAACKQKDEEYHIVRCWAFWEADQFRDFSRKDFAEAILSGNWPVVENKEDVEFLISEREEFSDPDEFYSELETHIKEYFGIE